MVKGLSKLSVTELEGEVEEIKMLVQNKNDRGAWKMHWEVQHHQHGGRGDGGHGQIS